MNHCHKELQTTHKLLTNRLQLEIVRGINFDGGVDQLDL